MSLRLTNHEVVLVDLLVTFWRICHSEMSESNYTQQWSRVLIFSRDTITKLTQNELLSILGRGAFCNDGRSTIQRRRLCCLQRHAPDFCSNRHLVWLWPWRQAEVNQRVPPCWSEDANRTRCNLSTRLVSFCHHASWSAIRDLHLRSPVLCSDCLVLHHLRSRSCYFCADVPKDKHHMCKWG